MDSKTEEETWKRLAKHPELLQEVKGLLDEVENRAGDLGTADQIEEVLIKRVRQIGRAGLTGWAEREAAKEAARRPAGARAGAKKKSGG